MKLTDVYEKTMKQIIEECDIVDQKIHTDEMGNIHTIEMKYRPKRTDAKDIDVPVFN